jgi:hypothetical protein
MQDEQETVELLLRELLRLSTDTNGDGPESHPSRDV